MEEKTEEKVEEAPEEEVVPKYCMREEGGDLKFMAPDDEYWKKLTDMHTFHLADEIALTMDAYISIVLNDINYMKRVVPEGISKEELKAFLWEVVMKCKVPNPDNTALLSVLEESFQKTIESDPMLPRLGKRVYESLTGSRTGGTMKPGEKRTDGSYKPSFTV